jgi:putative transcriptional regulator
VPSTCVDERVDERYAALACASLDAPLEDTSLSLHLGAALRFSSVGRFIDEGVARESSSRAATRVRGHMSSERFSTTPGTLIAVPQLKDPNFARSVVLMLAHAEEGAVGIVINDPTPFRCAELTPQLGHSWYGDHETRLMRGGPVDPDGFWLIHDDSVSFEDSIPAGECLVASRSREALDAIFEKQLQPLLMGVGCAGWGPGQLDQELATGSWLLGPVNQDVVFHWPRHEVWELSLRSMGIDPHMVMTSSGIQ